MSAIKSGEVLLIDTTFRKLNVNRAPLTFISTMEPVTNTSYPVMAILSGDITASTICDTLIYFKNTVFNFCKQALNMTLPDNIRSLNPLDNLPEHILSAYPNWRNDFDYVFPNWTERFQELVVIGGYEPKIFCIDMAEAELNGIVKAFPNASVHVCEFHLNQAILRLTLNDFYGNFISYKRIMQNDQERKNNLF